MKIHLVDGTYELFRHYFGVKATMVHKGVEVGATRSLLRSLLNLVRDGATHVGVAFDTVIESFRNEMFAAYKTGDGIPEDLFEQFALAEEGVRALGFVVWSMKEFEADDALATAAARWSAFPEVEQVVICTPDKDLYQCVHGDEVVVWDRRREIVFDEAAVLEKMGVGPNSIPDYLALVGDTADGIPGLERWGAKSSSAVLDRYGNLENIPEDEADWDIKVRGAKTLGKVFRENKENAWLYRSLATLRTDVPLEEALDDLRWQGGRREELRAFCEKIGDSRFEERVPLFIES